MHFQPSNIWHVAGKDTQVRSFLLSSLPLVVIGSQIFLEWRRPSVVPTGVPTSLLNAAHSWFTCKLSVLVRRFLDLLF